MRELKRMGAILALTLTVAMSGANAKTVFAAEEVTEQTVATEEVVTTEETVAEESVTTEDTTVVEEVVVTEDAVVEETVEETSAISTFSLRAVAVDDTDADADLKEAYAYTTWNDNNCYDDESMKNEVYLNGEEGEELSTIFKINYVGARAEYFDHGEDFTDYCTNLPEGLTLIKYTTNTGASYMRVQLAGTAAAGKYDVTVTVPKDRLVEKSGYSVSENGLSVTFYLTVNGEQIPVTVPATSHNHEHSYDWHTLKQVTDSEDGLEAYMCSCGDIEYTKVVSAYGLWLESVEEQILTAEENAVVEIKTDIWNTYSKDIMDALNTRTDVTLVTTFGKDENAVTFTIPAGACTLIEEEATALAGSVEEAAGTATSAAEETEWFGYAFLAGAYNN